MAKVEVTCLVCGKQELKCPSDAKRYKTCSLECRGKYSSNLLSQKVTQLCEVCGSDYKIRPSRIGVRRTCSNVCKYKLLEDHIKTLNGGKGADCISWKGGRVVNPYGYVFIHNPENPMANSRGYVREHRLIMSEIIGRPLKRGEEVHHIDGNKSNNSPDNLQLLTKAEHTALHAREREYFRDKIGRITGLKSKRRSTDDSKSED